MEDVSRLPDTPTSQDRWTLTLRRHDPVKNKDIWWKEEFDAVIFANGHYSIPFVSLSQLGQADPLPAMPMKLYTDSNW